MDKVCEELDDAKAEIDKLRTHCKSKTELSESLKKAHNEHLIKIQEASSIIEKQAQEISEKTEEIAMMKQMCEDTKDCLNEKESIIKLLRAANEKLKVDGNEKNQEWAEEKRCLVLALDEANEKNIDQEQKINVFKAELEGLKGLLSISQKRCLEAEKEANSQKKLRERDDILFKLEEEKRKVEDQLKWKKEQFKHLEEAHEKLRDQFRVSKKEWEQEKSTLLDEICSLQSSLNSQTRISKDLKGRLEMCNQALSHEETRRKYLEVEVAEFRKQYENVFSECQDARSQLECLNSQRDEEVAGLRHALSTKQISHKELEYQAGRLEQEYQELLKSLKDLQEAKIYESGNSSSFAKLRNRLKSVEQMHRDCSANLRAKEAEWSSAREKMAGDLNDCRAELEHTENMLKELNMEMEDCHSIILELKLQNEEISVMFLVLKSGISEAQLKIANVESDMDVHDKERAENVALLMKQLEMKNVALGKLQKKLDKECEKAASLLQRVESLDVVEEQSFLKQKELERYKEMLEESCKSHLHLKEQALQMEIDFKEKLREVCEALDTANSKLLEERERAASLLRRIESLGCIEQQRLLMQEELKRHKEMLAESNRCQLHLEEQALQIESDFQDKLKVLSVALDKANLELAKEHEKTISLVRRVESLDLIEEQQLQMQKEVDRYKKLYEEASTSQLHLEEQALQKESDYKRKLGEVSDALDRANSELAEKTSEGHGLEFELWIWKSIVERLKGDLEENQELRKRLEMSLLAQVEVGETIKQEKDGLLHLLQDRESRIDDLQQQIAPLVQKLITIESEAAARMENQSTKEKDKILEGLQRQTELLEHESLRRELEGVLQAKIGAEQIFESERKTLIQLVGDKDQKIDNLLQLVRSLESKFNSSLNLFSSQLVEKQEEIHMVYEAWEKIVAAEILAELEIEEKKLMILELEDDISNIEKKLELQEKSLSHSKQQALEIEAELEVKQVEMRTLANHLESKLKTSDELIDKLSSEKKNLIEDVTKLMFERENLMGFIESLGDRISELSVEDMKLIELLGRTVQSLDNKSPDLVLKVNGELFDNVKENTAPQLSPSMKKCESILEERSPFRLLN